jgi:peptidoglycan/xylan/chitin deacetylase (PgdA/CDA1 family)
MRSLIASLIGRRQRRHQAKWATFPKWPLDLSADFLNDLITGRPSPYGNGPTPVLLTHDLDSGEGLENLCKWFLDLEESVGARSTNYIVPKAWPIDHGRLRSVRDRGHDIGIHGYDHSNISPFLDSKERRTRLEAAHELVEEYGILGYRSPSLLRTKALLKDLSPYYLYDSSIPTSGGLFPIPNNGCASARPFRVEGIAELPITLPRDGSLRFLGYSPQAILDTWIDCAREISRSGGIVVLLTHCEARFSGNPAMRDIYRRFLEFVTSAGTFVWRRAAEVLEPVME